MQSLVVYSRSAARSFVSNVISDTPSCTTATSTPTLANVLLNNRLVNCLFKNLRFLSNSFRINGPQASPLSFSFLTPKTTSFPLTASSSSTAILASSLFTNTSSSFLGSKSTPSTSSSPSPASSLATLRLVTVYSGFSKDLTKPIIKKGVIGDDAWFIASQKSCDVLGVADGVGGWREAGVDPSKFSSNLMKTCKHIVEQNPETFGDTDVDMKTPMDILSQSYNALLENKNSLIGSSTACIIVFHRESSFLHTANLGDSGFVIVRNNKIVHRSQEQQHYFNSPFQMAILPSLSSSASLFNDSPESASTSSFELAEGDFVVVATDGLWDNFPESALIDEISQIKSFLIEDLEKAAHTIASKAIKLAFDPDYESPFAISARKHNILMCGGKPDDITVLLARVSR